MDDDHREPLDIDSFWEQADIDGSAEHPLERELCDHLDALARYRRLIDEAITAGRDDAVDLLLRQHDREERAVRRLYDALLRVREEQARAEPARADQAAQQDAHGGAARPEPPPPPAAPAD